MSWFVTNLIAVFLLPPLNLFLLLFGGLLLLKHRPKLARFLLSSALVLLWLCSIPYFSVAALHVLEDRATPLVRPFPEADAIVILGGGSYFHAPEYNNQDVASTGTLSRLRYGATLYREMHKPILVSGGRPLGDYISESQQMREILERDFQVPVTWTEDDSDNTFENAHYSFAILKQAGIKKIYLVTQAWHIPRAAQIFRRAGFEVVEAPTMFTTRYKLDLLDFLPNAAGLGNSSIFIHELIGLVWYEIKSFFVQESIVVSAK